MKKLDRVGLIGLAVMGKNLVRNIVRQGVEVTVMNRTAQRTKEFMNEVTSEEQVMLIDCYDYQSFISALPQPRVIFLLIQAGKATDETIQKLIPHLAQNDLIIDLGNAHFPDTERRAYDLESRGFRFLGCGISGGEEGALLGPALFPGGNYEAYQQIEPLLDQIAAKVDGEPCCSYLGTGGAGHYVKMVHNGIEYGDMQLISEVYQIIREGIGLTAEEIAQVFEDWNAGELKSYLTEITSEILKVKDPATQHPLVDVILDKAGQKGTGRWTGISALELGVPLSVITTAVYSRNLSAIKNQRVNAAQVLQGPEKQKINEIWNEMSRDALLEMIRRALFSGKICSYAQGFIQLQSASKEYKWELPYAKIAKSFRGGCIIRASFLEEISEAFSDDKDLDNLLLDPYFSSIINKYQEAWRDIVSLAAKSGLPAPALGQALAYYDSYRSKVLPANLIQAQRDYFGAHTYERNDRSGSFHYNWLSNDGEEQTE